jgi:hypothetical protein
MILLDWKSKAEADEGRTQEVAEVPPAPLPEVGPCSVEMDGVIE